MELAGLNFLDVFIALFMVVVMLRGARTGFLAGVFSLVGVVVGASAGSRIAPSLMPEDGNPIYGAGITLGSILAFAVLGEVVARTIGGSIRDRLSSPTSETIDGLGGAALGFALSLVLVWAVGAFALQSPPLAGLHPAVQDSRILQSLNERMPSGLITQAVADLQPLPQIRGPEPEVSAPEGSIVEDPDVQAASGRTLRVSGIACGYGVEGSGWVAGRDLVVTNAHVIAGSDDTTVTTQGGIELEATPVYYAPADDLALLRVGAEIPPLPVAGREQAGRRGAVLGYPENGPYALVPARIGETRATLSEDSYGRGPIEREILAVGGLVRSGNSGGPVIDARGRVLGTVFAATTSGPRGGFAIPTDRVAGALSRVSDQVSTGPCTL
jgi:uncharacterized membrane protein required for colicin V production